MRRYFFLLPLLALLGAGCKAVPFQSQERTSCVYETASYSAGESFPAADGCNTCNCGETGLVACTKMACLGREDKPITCQTDGDCLSQNIDTSICSQGTWACVNNVCELSCGFTTVY